MMDTIRDLSRFFATTPLTSDDVIRRLGPVATDHGPHGALELHATDARLAKVKLFRDDTGAPYLLSIDLAEGARPTLGAIRKEFGPGRAMRVELEAPAGFTFPPPDPKGHYTVSPSVRLADGVAPSDDAPIANISLRRDEAGD